MVRMGAWAGADKGASDENARAAKRNSRLKRIMELSSKSGTDIRMISIENAILSRNMPDRVSCGRREFLGPNLGLGAVMNGRDRSIRHRERECASAFC